MNIIALFEELQETHGGLPIKDFCLACMEAVQTKVIADKAINKGTPRLFTITHGADEHNRRVLLTVEDLRAIQKRILENDLSRDRLVVDSILSGLITGDLDIYELKQK